MTIDAIKNDPAWMGGEYKTPPQDGLRTASDILIIAGSAPLQMQKSYPTRETADAWLEDATAKNLATLDANDFMYQVASSRNYDPSGALDKIKAPVMWINSGDDFINPPELGIAQEEVKKIAHAQFVLIPASDQTHGHGTHTWAAVWKDHLAELLQEIRTQTLAEIFGEPGMSLSNSQDRALRERAEAVIPNGMYGHQSVRALPDNFPQFFSKAKGARLWDADGAEYLDFMCGYGPNLLGYAHPKIDAAAARRQQLGDAMTGPAPVMVELAEKFVSMIGHADWAIFCKNGTDATTMAMMAARACEDAQDSGGEGRLSRLGAVVHAAPDRNRAGRSRPFDRLYLQRHIEPRSSRHRGGRRSGGYLRFALQA